MASVHLSVSGMTCNHCSGRVEQALKAVAGVYGVFVDLAEGSAEVDFDDGKTNADELVAAVKAAGYGAEKAAGQ